jgi:hypothetical protein
VPHTRERQRKRERESRASHWGEEEEGRSLARRRSPKLEVATGDGGDRLGRAGIAREQRAGK